MTNEDSIEYTDLSHEAPQDVVACEVVDDTLWHRMLMAIRLRIKLQGSEK
ncbi:hypothetical protein ACFV24_32980 [Nocardia fluminea]